ncbi:MAG: caspase family protein [Bacteroidales bacterium]|nr:caspase family protein [Bacteroidales bacterium]
MKRKYYFTCILALLSVSVTFGQDTSVYHTDYSSRFYMIDESDSYAYNILYESGPDDASISIVDIEGQIYFYGNWQSMKYVYYSDTILVINYQDSIRKFHPQKGLIERWKKPNVDITSVFENGYFFEKDGKYGFSQYGKQPNIAVYDEYYWDLHQRTEKFVKVKKDGKTGLFDVCLGKEVIPCKYSSIQFCMNDHFFRVRNLDDKWGVIRDGNIIIPCAYNYISHDTPNNLYNIDSYYFEAFDKKKDSHIVFDINGKVIMNSCDVVYSSNLGYGNYLYLQKNNTLYCFDVLTHKEKKRFEGYEISTNGFNRSVGGVHFLNDYVVVTKNGKYGILDVRKGKEVVKCDYDMLDLCMDSQHAISYNKHNKMIEFFNLENGNIERISHIVELPQYENGMYIVKRGRYECGVLNEAGEIIIPLKYDEITVDKWWIIVSDVGIFDRKGNLKCSGRYDLNVESHYKDDYYLKIFKVYNKGYGKYDYFLYNHLSGDIYKWEYSSTSLSEIYWYLMNAEHQNRPSEVDVNIPITSRISSNSYAFIIANENYAVKDVPYALNDGRIFKSYCEKTLGIPSSHIKMWEDATQGNIITCVEEMKQVANVYDGDINIFFYYAGHAFPDESTKQAYLLPVDGDSRITTTGYGLKRMYDELSDIPAKSIVCFIDACFSGATRDNGVLLEGRGVAIKVKDDVPHGNVVVFSSATGAETAHYYEEKKHGLFTYFLLKKLQESNGNITLGELADYIVKKVKITSYEINGKMQTPTVIPSPKLQSTWQEIKL